MIANGIKACSLFLILSTSLHAKDVFPPETENGFKNINGRKEFEYFAHPGEKVWTEFGRAYWRKVGAEEANMPMKSSKAAEKVTQTTSQKLAAPKRTAVKAAAPNLANINLASARNIAMTLDVKFELNRAEIIQRYSPDIDIVGRKLTENKMIKVEIQGHTDTTGTQSFNYQLSSNRALAVKAYLVRKYGINPERIRTKAMASSNPIASNEIRSGREKNRRVTLTVLK